MKRTQDEPEASMPDPTVMFGAMEVNPCQPPLKRLMMEHLQGEQLRKVQSMGNLRGGDAAPAICRVVEGVPREPVLPNANGYTSDTAVPTTSARQRNTAPMRGGSFSRQPCQPCPISSSHTPSYRRAVAPSGTPAHQHHIREKR